MKIKYLRSKQAPKTHSKVNKNHQSNQSKIIKVINQRQVTCWYHLILLVGVVDQVAFVYCLHKSHIHFSWGEMWPSFVVSINHIFIYLGEKYE